MNKLYHITLNLWTVCERQVKIKTKKENIMLQCNICRMDDRSMYGYVRKNWLRLIFKLKWINEELLRFIPTNRQEPSFSSHNFFSFLCFSFSILCLYFYHFPAILNHISCLRDDMIYLHVSNSVEAITFFHSTPFVIKFSKLFS